MTDDEKKKTTNPLYPAGGDPRPSLGINVTTGEPFAAPPPVPPGAQESIDRANQAVREGIERNRTKPTEAKR